VAAPTLIKPDVPISGIRFTPILSSQPCAVFSDRSFTTGADPWRMSDSQQGTRVDHDRLGDAWPHFFRARLRRECVRSAGVEGQVRDHVGRLRLREPDIHPIGGARPTRSNPSAVGECAIGCRPSRSRKSENGDPTVGIREPS
jgi:hypothetical protein